MMDEKEEILELPDNALRELKEGEEYTIRIPSPDGRDQDVFTVSITGGQALVSTTSGKPYSVKIYE